MPAAGVAPLAAPTPTAQDDGLGTVDAGLRQRCWLVDDQQGRLALAGPALALGEAIDAEATALFVRHFGARAIDLPTLIVDHRAGSGGHRQADRPRSAHALDHRIAAVACQACLTLLRGQPLGGQGEALTWHGRALRAAANGLVASSELRLRALALIGSAEQVTVGSALLPGLVGELAAGLDLPCHIRDDRPTDASGQQTILLAPGRLGRQAPRVAGVIWTAGGRGDPGLGLATSEDRPATIAWLGLALESWVRAAFGHHGFEPGRWPARSRERVFG